MKALSFREIVRALREADVRFLVAGGIAVIAHGYLRLTNDVDVVIQLTADNIKRAFHALAKLEYKPTIPVTPEQFADPAIREGWIRDKDMKVLQLWSDRHRETPIDILVSELPSFDEEYAEAMIKPLYNTLEVPFVRLPTLIAMKEKANREQDRIDVEHLRMRMEDDDG